MKGLLVDRYVPCKRTVVLGNFIEKLPVHMVTFFKNWSAYFWFKTESVHLLRKDRTIWTSKFCEPDISGKQHTDEVGYDGIRRYYCLTYSSGYFTAVRFYYNTLRPYVSIFVRTIELLLFEYEMELQELGNSRYRVMNLEHCTDTLCTYCISGCPCIMVVYYYCTCITRCIRIRQGRVDTL